MKNQQIEYLTPRFKVGDYDWGVFIGPAAGEKAVDFRLTDFVGNEVKLSDFHGKWLVIETGSATCSMYTKDIPAMKSLREEFSDVEFIVVYVREAHPGERMNQHKTFDDKLDAAKLLPKRYKEHRTILIDKLNGDMHRAYGSMPNVVYIIRPDGTVHYRSNWSTVYDVRAALTETEIFHTHENADMKKLTENRGLWVGLRTMWTGGFLALWDFVVATPALIKQHKLVDAYYSTHGKFKNQPHK